MTFGDSLRKAMDSELIEPPKGTYKVKIDEASAFESKAGDEYAKLILEIVEGDLTGERFQHFMGFKNEIAKQINGEALASYGVNLTEVNELSDLDDQLDALRRTNVIADVGVSYKDGYVQIKVHGSRTGVSLDIPNDTNGFATREQEQTFEAAAAKFGDEPAF